jgi:2-polyprenyl-3-methyl-5-hydroxy-6-metoxy-1,4-benzoquinol methylase
MKSSKRLEAKEWMDLGLYSPEEYEDCLYQLDRIGRFLGGNRATFSAFDRLKVKLGSILDVGCGSGSFTVALARRYPEAKVVGVDIAPEAIAYAKKQCPSDIKNIEFICLSSPDLPFDKSSFDVVTSTLVCHHLTDDEIVQFLKRAVDIAAQAVILNDLHRHFLATWSYKCIAPLLFPNPMVIHDGLLSIKRAFKRKDWDFYFKESDVHNVQCSWHFAFRWIVMITKYEK